MFRLTCRLFFLALSGILVSNCGSSTDVISGSERDGTTQAPVVPTAITVSDSACVAFSNGTVKCWGGHAGAMTSIPGINSATSVSCGQFHCCALLNDGRVQCWGQNELLGNGTRDGTYISQPAYVPNISTAVSVAAGGEFTCAALTDGTLECWGSIPGDIPGLTTTSAAFSPVTIPGISNAATVSISSSWASGACILTKDSAVECWQTGSPLKTIYASDTNPAKMIVSGYQFECALLGDQSMSCWGSNDMGQLRGTGSQSIAYVATGFKHTCAVLATGSVTCWGSNNMGQLGTGSWELSPPPSPVLGISTAKIVAAGDGTTCALLTNGTVQCWGSNGSGLLGDGTATESNVPVTVQGL